MKKLITNYTFVPWEWGVGYITFNDYSVSNPFDLTKLQSIYNTKNGKYLYNVDKNNQALDDGVSYYATNSWVVVDNNKLVFAQPTNINDHLSTDKLQILIEEDDLINPWVWAFAITPSDSTNLSSVPREIYVWVGGNIAVTFVEWGTVTLLNVPDGGRLPYRVNKVFSTWTTATNLIAII